MIVVKSRKNEKTPHRHLPSPQTMSIVSQEEVMTLARTMRLPRKRDVVLLFKQVEWRLTKRVMILKWTLLPSDVVSHLLSYIGNESETESRKMENKDKYARSRDLAVFREESTNWLRLTHQQANPRMRESSRRVLIEMGDKLKKHPKFPWEE